jgi:anthraniloyl-CoA monooxygenase
MWNDEHVAAWRRITDFVHANSKAKICLQLGHSGGKGSTQLGWEVMDAAARRGQLAGDRRLRRAWARPTSARGR